MENTTLIALVLLAHSSKGVSILQVYTYRLLSIFHSHLLTKLQFSCLYMTVQFKYQEPKLQSLLYKNLQVDSISPSNSNPQPNSFVLSLYSLVFLLLAILPATQTLRFSFYHFLYPPKLYYSKCPTISRVASISIA